MHRPDSDRSFTCVTCEFAVTGTPVFHVGLPFCCAGCVAGGPCICSYDEPDLARPSQRPDGPSIAVMAAG
jgi:hypothetical protein